MAARVGFIGLGDIGKPMAVNLVKKGFDVMVYDLREEPLRELAALGAEVATSPGDIGAHSEFIDLVLLNDAQVEEVTLGKDGVLQSARPGTIVAIHSTVLPKTIKKVHDAGKAKGVEVFDAQISGGARGAAASTLTVMAGGPKELLDKCRPHFAAFAGTIFHLGGLGTGAAAKIAHNLIVYVNFLAAAEGSRLAKKLGIDPDAFEALVKASAGQSFAMDDWRARRKRWAEDPRPERLPALYYKDLKLALELGHDANLSLPGAALAQQRIDFILHWDDLERA